MNQNIDNLVVSSSKVGGCKQCSKECTFNKTFRFKVNLVFKKNAFEIRLTLQSMYIEKLFTTQNINECESISNIRYWLPIRKRRPIQ